MNFHPSSRERDHEQLIKENKILANSRMKLQQEVSSLRAENSSLNNEISKLKEDIVKLINFVNLSEEDRKA